MKWIVMSFASKIVHAVENLNLPIIRQKTICGQIVPIEHTRFEHFTYRKCKRCESKLKREKQ